MKHVRWYDKDANLQAVFEFIQGLDVSIQAEMAKDILQILVKELNIDIDQKMNEINKGYNYEYRRWYDNNIDLFSSFELIKNLPDELRNEVIKKIIESALLMYFSEQNNKG